MQVSEPGKALICHNLTWCWGSVLWMDEILHHPHVNTNKQWFTMDSNWCRISSIHSMVGLLAIIHRTREVALQSGQTLLHSWELQGGYGSAELIQGLAFAWPMIHG